MLARVAAVCDGSIVFFSSACKLLNYMNYIYEIWHNKCSVFCRLC